MAGIDQLKTRYHEYTQFNRDLYANAKLTDGLFGFGNDPKKDPGHTQFFQDIAAIVQEMASLPPTAEEATEAVRWILDAESLVAKNSSASWMMIAAQQHAEKLIPFLLAEDAARILKSYTLKYPKRIRLPIQNQLIKSLKAQSKK